MLVLFTNRIDGEPGHIAAELAPPRPDPDVFEKDVFAMPPNAPLDPLSVVYLTSKYHLPVVLKEVA